MSVVELSVVDGVGWVLLNRPAQMNSVTVELAEQLERGLLELGARADVNVIAVRGAEGNFCAGGDFEEVERLRAVGTDGLRGLFAAFAAACRAVETVDVPVVAVIEGAAAAGGFEFMLASDIVLVRSDAKISDNHIRFGQVPGGGSTQRLARLVGRQRALSILLAGERMSGAEAYAAGLAHASWSAEEFEEKVGTFLSALAGRRRDAVVKIKRLVYDGLELDLADGIVREMDVVVAHIGGEAGGAGVAAFSSRSQS